MNRADLEERVLGSVLLGVLSIKMVPLSFFTVPDNIKIWHAAKETLSHWHFPRTLGNDEDNNAIPLTIIKEGLGRDDCILCDAIAEKGATKLTAGWNLERLRESVIGDEYRQKLVTLSQQSSIIPIKEALMDASLSIDGLMGQLPVEKPDISEQTNQVIENLEKRDIQLISTGIKDIDAMIGGFPRKEIITIAARPGHGKTTLCTNFLYNFVADQGLKAVMFSVEMSTDMLLKKLLSLTSSTSFYKMFTYSFSKEELERLKRAREEMIAWAQNKMYIYDDVYDSYNMIQIINNLKPDVVLIDFIQLMRVNLDQLNLSIMQILGRLKEIAKKNNFMLVIVSQLNREIERRATKIPVLSDLSESGWIEALSAYVLFLNWGYIYDKELPKDAVDLYIAKARYGETGKVKLNFNPDKNYFE